MLVIARGKRKTLKKEKGKRKMRKNQTTTIKNIFNFAFLHRKIYILLENMFRKTYFILSHLYYSNCRRRTSTQNTWQYTRYFNINFNSNRLLFFGYILEKYLQLRKAQKHLLGKIVGPSHTSNQIYLLWNCSSNYVYLKAKYITLKGIGKIGFYRF